MDPEAKARISIDAKLEAAGWLLQDRADLDWTAALGVAVREFRTTKGYEVDYAQKAHTEQLGKLQAQLKAQTEACTRQSKEFNDSLKKMQETNGELNKSLQKLTAQNTQAAKDLQEAKDRARDLEKQLEEALKKGGSNLWMWIAILAVIAFFAVLLFK